MYFYYTEKILTLWRDDILAWLWYHFTVYMYCSDGKASVYNAGDLGLIPGLGRSLVSQRLKRLPPLQETQVRSLGWEDPLEKEMATHSSILAWRIPWTGEPGRLQSMGSQRVRYDWATSLHFGKILWRRKWQSTPVLLSGKSQGQRSLVSCSPWSRKESDTTERLHFTYQKYNFFFWKEIYI